MNTTQKASAIFKDMGKGMWTTGKGFGKVGMLFAGVECVIESVRGCCCFLLVHCCDKFFSTAPKTIYTIHYLLECLSVVSLRGILGPKLLLVVVWLSPPFLLR